MGGIASAERYEALVREGDRVYDATLDMIFDIWAKEGRIWGTVIPTKEEEFRELIMELPLIQQTLQNPSALAADYIDAAAKSNRLQELQRELGDGRTPNEGT